MVVYPSTDSSQIRSHDCEIRRWPISPSLNMQRELHGNLEWVCKGEEPETRMLLQEDDLYLCSQNGFSCIRLHETSQV